MATACGALDQNRIDGPAEPRVEPGALNPPVPSEFITFRNVGNWRVGDTLIYTVENAYITGEIQYSVRKVVWDTGDAFWLCGDLGYSTTRQITTDCNLVQQYLVRKSDGVVIKESSGLNGVSHGPFKNPWQVESASQGPVSVPLGDFQALALSGKLYHYTYPALDPRYFSTNEKWYAEDLPLDGLIQSQREQNNAQDPKPIVFRLFRAIRGHALAR